MNEFRDTSGQSANQEDSGISFATWQDRQLSVILARMDQLSHELRETQAQAQAAARIRYQESGRPVAAALDQQAAAAQANLEAANQLLQEQVTRLRASEKKYTDENQILSSMAGASTLEASNLRRLAAEIQSSLSWKITAPLRFLTKPLFRLLAPAPKTSPPPSVPNPEVPIALSSPAPAPDTSAASLAAILPELRRAESIAIIPCAIPFSSTLNQRPISCARYLADRGTTVLYIAWQWQPDEPVPQAWEEVYPRVLHLPLFGFLDNIETIAAASQAKSSYLCTLPSPALVEIVRPLRAAGYHIHYDIMDEWEEFHRGGEAPWFSAPIEREMVILADTVSAVSDKLAQKFDPLRSDIAVIRNGYQPSALACEQFIAAHTPMRSPKVVGYFGHFSDAWFDWDTLIYAAGQLPDVEFELIGWGISEATRLRLNQLPNIRPIGIVPQNELHRHARTWWAGMIPFRPSPVSAAVDPLKIYEYLHLGLSTVVTGISGIANYPLVHFAADREDFVAALNQITGRPDEQRLSEVAQFLKSCVWEERFAKLNSMLAEPSGLAYLYGR